MSFSGRRRLPGVVAAASAVALLLSSCGGTSKASVATLSNGQTSASPAASKTLTGKALEDALLTWAQCMRTNGVNVPDPTVDANGNVILGRRPGAGTGDGTPGAGGPGNASPGTDAPGGFDRTAFQKARDKCGQPPGGAGAGLTPANIQQIREAGLKLAQCMRDQGITDFPDPDFSRFGPGAGPAPSGGTGATGQRRGIFGSVDFNDPKVQTAFTTCRKKLQDAGVNFPGGGRFGGGGGRGGAGTGGATAGGTST